MERKKKEKERRVQMKELCFNLASLIPRQQPSSSSIIIASNTNSNSKDTYIPSQQQQQQHNLDEAVTYISQLKERVEKLKKIRDSKLRLRVRGASACNPTPAAAVEEIEEMPGPVIEVRSDSEDNNLEVVLVSTQHNHRFELHRVIAILDEEGADVKNANVSVVGDQVFYTIHSQALSSRIGLEASRVLERLRDLVS